MPSITLLLTEVRSLGAHCIFRKEKLTRGRLQALSLRPSEPCHYWFAFIQVAHRVGVDVHLFGALTSIAKVHKQSYFCVQAINRCL